MPWGQLGKRPESFPGDSKEALHAERGCPCGKAAWRIYFSYLRRLAARIHCIIENPNEIESLHHRENLNQIVSQKEALKMRLMMKSGNRRLQWCKRCIGKHTKN